MNEILDHELYRGRTSRAADREARNRADVLTARRQARRHRLAERVRSVADRLEG
ncbi:hypothetical protein [Nocardioides rubriscoriae]|uniref:hypothetical protein n=1 Tax=Nocardioides rubriscoriae TaxID=642762 RepID=UPI0014782ABF|nr:hypothetical protein [Nocardioides rubriscoriae]